MVPDLRAPLCLFSSSLGEEPWFVSDSMTFPCDHTETTDQQLWPVVVVLNTETRTRTEEDLVFVLNQSCS